MGDQPPTTVALSIGEAGTLVGLYTAIVSNLDTVTLTDFTDILNVYVIDLFDNTESPVTKLTNVITLADAGIAATQKILIYAQGT